MASGRTTHREEAATVPKFDILAPSSSPIGPFGVASHRESEAGKTSRQPCVGERLRTRRQLRPRPSHIEAPCQCTCGAFVVRQERYLVEAARDG